MPHCPHVADASASSWRSAATAPASVPPTDGAPPGVSRMTTGWIVSRWRPIGPASEPRGTGDADRLELLAAGVANDERAADLGADRARRDERVRAIDVVDDEAERSARGARGPGSDATVASHREELHVADDVERRAVGRERVDGERAERSRSLRRRRASRGARRDRRTRGRRRRGRRRAGGVRSSDACSRAMSTGCFLPSRTPTPCTSIASVHSRVPERATTRHVAGRRCPGAALPAGTRSPQASGRPCTRMRALSAPVRGVSVAPAIARVEGHEVDARAGADELGLGVGRVVGVVVVAVGDERDAVDGAGGLGAPRPAVTTVFASRDAAGGRVCAQPRPRATGRKHCRGGAQAPDATERRRNPQKRSTDATDVELRAAHAGDVAERRLFEPAPLHPAERRSRPRRRSSSRSCRCRPRAPRGRARPRPRSRGSATRPARRLKSRAFAACVRRRRCPTARRPRSRGARRAWRSAHNRASASFMSARP